MAFVQPLETELERCLPGDEAPRPRRQERRAHFVSAAILRAGFASQLGARRAKKHTKSSANPLALKRVFGIVISQKSCLIFLPRPSTIIGPIVARELWKIAQEYQAEAAKLDNGRLSDIGNAPHPGEEDRDQQIDATEARPRPRGQNGELVPVGRGLTAAGMKKTPGSLRTRGPLIVRTL